MRSEQQIDHTAFDPAAYGDGAAAIYDQLYPAVESRLVVCLADLARGGPALDLGVGTGRVAIPLRRLGIAVHGIDASLPMIESLRARAEGVEIPVLHGDFATASLGATRYSLVYSLVSTVFLLPSLTSQQACLENVARHLAPDGVFVSEAFRDDESFPEPHTRTIPIVTRSGVANYRVTTLAPPPHVFDDMASRAGLRLRCRWSNWSRTPYQPTQPRHISVYEQA
jgi:SAM-dependent methyltransferase